MADRFCEPGLYGAAVVTANTTSGNGTLTVTAVTSGRVGIGARVIGAGIPADTFITALGTGRGGNGTYTMSQNATATQTGVTVTAEQGNPALDPEWGVAQEGDGLAKGAATPATAHIVFTGTPSGTISVCGVTLSPTWGSDADAAANGLATAINAATGNVTTTSYNSGVQLRNAVFARGPSGGAPAGTCQIMTRVGSALHNGRVCIAHSLTNVNEGASSLSFSGGASGAWGMLFNGRAAAWPSGIAKAGYGLWCATQPFVGSQAGHNVHIRADVPPLNTEAFCECAPAATVSPNTGVVTMNIIDDGTHWASSANQRLEIAARNAGGGSGFVLNFRDTLNFHVIGRARSSDGKRTLYMREYTAATVVWGVRIGPGYSSIRFVEFEGIAGSVFPFIAPGGTPSGNGAKFLVSHCRIASQATGNAPLDLFRNINANPVVIDELEIDNTGATAPHSGVLSAPGNNSCEALIRGAKFIGFVAGSKLFAAPHSGSGSVHVRFENTSFGNVSLNGPNVTQGSAYDFNSCFSSFSQHGNRDFFIDNNRGFVEWNSTQGQPTLNAVLPDGVTKWSIKMLPQTTAGLTNIASPLVSPRLAKINSLADGARTFTVEFCVSDQTTWTKADVSIVVTYRDVNGNLVVLNTLDESGGALDVSTVTWSQESGGKVTFVSGSTVYHDKRKLSVSTPAGKNLPQGEEVGVYFRIHRTVANTTQMVFVDPDVSIA